MLYSLQTATDYIEREREREHPSFTPFLEKIIR